MIGISVFQVLVCVINGLPSSGFQSDELWFNLPASPLKIARSSKGTILEGLNYSEGRIVGYRMGWFTESSRDVRVTCQTTRKTVDIPPKVLGSSIVHFVGLVAAEKVNAYSHKNKVKLGITEVVFADGSVWKAQGGVENAPDEPLCDGL